MSGRGYRRQGPGGGEARNGPPSHQRAHQPLEREIEAARHQTTGDAPSPTGIESIIVGYERRQVDIAQRLNRQRGEHGHASFETRHLGAGCIFRMAVKRHHRHGGIHSRSSKDLLTAFRRHWTGDTDLLLHVVGGTKIWTPYRGGRHRAASLTLNQLPRAGVQQVRPASGRTSGGPVSALRRDRDFRSASGDLARTDPATRRTAGCARPGGRLFPEIGNSDTHPCISSLTRCTIGPLWYQP